MARTDITPLAKLVLFAMASHVRDERYEVWPSQERLAALVGATRQGVRLAIDSIVAAGLIDVTKSDGLRSPHVYRLRCEESIQRCKVAPEDDVNGVDTKELVQPELLDKSTARAKTDLFTASPDALQAVWNEHRGGLPEWRFVSPSQRQQATARLRELPLERWPEVVQIMAASAFCVEKRLGPSFLIRPGTWPRALNGEIAGWGGSSSGDRAERALTPAQALKRRIERSSTDDNLAEALAAQYEVEP